MTSIRKLKKRIRRENWVSDDYILNGEQIRRWIHGETRLNCCVQLRCCHLRLIAIRRAKKGVQQAFNRSWLEVANAIDKIKKLEE